MVTPRYIPREEFPRSPSRAEGMISLDVRTDNFEMNLIRDIKYIERGGVSLYVQLILPDAISPRTPLVVYVTGSAFHWQNIPQTIPRLCLLANKGAAVASVQYRGAEAAPFPAQALDVKAAVRFIKGIAPKYGLNPANVFLMGDSSGGHTALIGGITAGAEFEETVYAEHSSEVRGIIDLYGVVDISRMNDELSAFDHTTADCPAGLLIGGVTVPDHPALYEPTVVTRYITPERRLPPVLILHGTNDEVVPFGQSCLLYERLRECGKQARFYAVEGAHHGGREFWAEQTLGIIADFLAENSVKA